MNDPTKQDVLRRLYAARETLQALAKLEATQGHGHAFVTAMSLVNGVNEHIGQVVRLSDEPPADRAEAETRAVRLRYCVSQTTFFAARARELWAIAGPPAHETLSRLAGDYHEAAKTVEWMNREYAAVRQEGDT